jgi:hypothetical protein
MEPVMPTPKSDTEFDCQPLSLEPQLIQSLYAALSQKEGFHIFLEQLPSAINAYAAELVVIQKEPLQIDRIWYSGLSEEFIEWYIGNNMVESDLVSNNAIHCAPGLFQTALSLIEQVKHLPDYERWQQDQNLIDSAWLVIDNTKTHTALLAMQRTLEQGAYQQTELAQLNRLAPYIKQAVLLYQQLDKANVQNQTLTNLVDALPNPCFILNERSELLCANRKAETLIAENNHLTLKNNRLEFKERQHRQSFFTASTQVIRASMGQGVFDSDVVIMKNKDLSSLMMTLAPIEGGGILVTLYDSNDRLMPSPELIAIYFNLTPAESILCADLIVGISLNEIAENRCKSEATIRSQHEKQHV